MAELSARMILSIMQMKWMEGPVECLEGSGFYIVCFIEDEYVGTIAVAMGFLGGLFTEKALNLIIGQIEKYWKWIKFKCEEPGYRHFMNQGIVANGSNILGAYFLELHRGGFDTAIKKSYEVHSKVIDTYISEEGFCVEGGHYYEYSFASTIKLWHVYARYVGKAVEEVVPERFKKFPSKAVKQSSTGDYLTTVVYKNPMDNSSSDFSLLI